MKSIERAVSTAIIASLVILIVAVAGIGGYFLFFQQTNSQNPQSSSTLPVSTTSTYSATSTSQSSTSSTQLSLSTSTAPSSAVHGQWSNTTAYPAGGEGAQCVTFDGFVYCVGGLTTNQTYYAQLTSLGLGQWHSTSPYPTSGQGNGAGTLFYGSCVAWSGFIYCVGGQHDGLPASSDTYFAPLSSSGIGAWKVTTSYPEAVGGFAGGPRATISCVASASYIYCLGGGGAYFAPLSQSGIGGWEQTTNYNLAGYNYINYQGQVNGQTCVTMSGYIYCIAGGGLYGSPINETFYAQLNSSGIGSWARTTSYPINDTRFACTILSGVVYCIGGETYKSVVYHASLSASGIGAWTTDPNYPTGIEDQACFASTEYIYCVLGFASNQGNNPQTAAAYYLWP